MILATVFTSCTKDDPDPDPTDEDNRAKLSKIYVDNELALEFVYNSANKIIRQRYFEDGAEYYRDDFEYASNGNLTKQVGFDVEDNELDFTHTYEYNSQNLLTKVTSTGDDYDDTQAFIYNADNTLKEVIVTSPTSENWKETFTYNTAKNIVKTTWLFGSQAMNEDTNSYDDKKNPFYKILPYQTYSWNAEWLISPNNVTKSVYKDGYDGETSETTFTYTYNSDGYPTQMTWLDDDDDTETWRFEYK